MGISMFGSSDSRDCGGNDFVRVNSTPDPTRFTLVKQRIVNGYPILWVHYSDVENYEGNKILMYEKNFDLRRLKNRIDPHFFELGDSPIARFVPTEEGYNMAITIAKNLL